MSGDAGTGGPPPPHRFGTGEPFSVGLEEELLLVDADTLELAHVADQVLPGTASRVSESTTRRPRRSSRCARAVRLGGGGHRPAGRGSRRCAHRRRRCSQPDSTPTPGSSTSSSSSRSATSASRQQMQGLHQAHPGVRLHVHVGLPSPRRRSRHERPAPAAAAAARAGRELAVLVRGRLGHGQLARRGDPRLPRARHPPLLRSWEQYLACLDAVRAGGGPTDHTMVWWDAVRSRASARWSCARWTCRPTSTRPRRSRLSRARS